MKGSKALTFITILLLLTFGMAEAIPQYIQSPPLSQVITTQVGDVKPGQVGVPMITWGGDMATIYANGNSLITANGSIFHREGLNLKLFLEDDFKKQLEMYLRGETPYLRGTVGMINMAAEVLARDPRTKPVFIYQLTWSRGGDALIVKSHIKTAKDLCGKTIAVQAYGPHVDYLTKIVTDACGSIDKVRIKWTKDLFRDVKNTPGAAFQEDRTVDAAFVISPDAQAITAGAAKGAEGIKGSRILFSTKTADRVIADVYVVRSDYFQSRRAEVEKFVRGLMLGEEALRDLMKSKTARAAEYKKAMITSAKILLDSETAVADVEGLYGDAEFVGYRGNVKFFGEPNYPRNFANVTTEIQNAFVTIGFLSKRVPMDHARWNYNALKAGLRDTQGVEAPKFVRTEVEKVVAKKYQEGKLGEGELFSLEIPFPPGKDLFPTEFYAGAFDQVVKLISSYSGAVLTVEGHSDPLEYLRAKKRGVPEVNSNPALPGLKDYRQASKDLGYKRAKAVMESLITYARSKGVKLDTTQFVVVSHGFDKPKTGTCGADPCAPKTEEAWKSNMRAEFRIIQVEAESSVFKPLE